MGLPRHVFQNGAKRIGFSPGNRRGPTGNASPLPCFVRRQICARAGLSKLSGQAGAGPFPIAAAGPRRQFKKQAPLGRFPPLLSGRLCGSGGFIARIFAPYVGHKTPLTQRDNFFQSWLKNLFPPRRPPNFYTGLTLTAMWIISRRFGVGSTYKSRRNGGPSAGGVRAGRYDTGKVFWGGPTIAEVISWFNFRPFPPTRERSWPWEKFNLKRPKYNLQGPQLHRHPNLPPLEPSSPAIPAIKVPGFSLGGQTKPLYTNCRAATQF